MDIQHMDMQYGHAAWISSKDKKHGDAARTYSMDVQHGHGQNGQAALTCSMDIQHGHTAWSRDSERNYPFHIGLQCTHATCKPFVSICKGEPLPKPAVSVFLSNHKAY
jgi:hypothetical protein